VQVVDRIVFAAIVLLLGLYAAQAYILGPVSVWAIAAFVCLAGTTLLGIAILAGCIRAFTRGPRHAWPLSLLVPFAVVSVLPQRDHILGVLATAALDHLPVVAAGMLAIWPVRRAIALFASGDAKGALLLFCGVVACGCGALFGTRLADGIIVATVGHTLLSDIRGVRSGMRPATPSLKYDVAIWPGEPGRARMVLNGPGFTGVSIFYDRDVSPEDESSSMARLFGRYMDVWKLGPNVFLVDESNDP